MGDGLDMRRRLPGLLGRFGGIVAVDANRFWQRIIKSPSAEADMRSQPGGMGRGKIKGSIGRDWAEMDTIPHADGGEQEPALWRFART